MASWLMVIKVLQNQPEGWPERNDCQPRRMRENKSEGTAGHVATRPY
jgi:hypothetical protein